LGELTGLFVLVWLRKNVKVIQAGKDALLAKLKNVPKPKKLHPPHLSPRLYNHQLKPRGSTRFVFSERSAILCIW